MGYFLTVLLLIDSANFETSDSWKFYCLKFSSSETELKLK